MAYPWLFKSVCMVRLPSAEEALYWNLRLVPPSCEMAYVFRKKFIGEEIIEHLDYKFQFTFTGGKGFLLEWTARKKEHLLQNRCSIERGFPSNQTLRVD